MTMSRHDRDQLFRHIDRRLDPNIERLMHSIEEGVVDWDRDKWSVVLDYIGTRLQERLLFSEEIPEDQRGDKNPLYHYFEGFQRARMQGVLENPQHVAHLWLMVKTWQEVAHEVLDFMGVKYIEATPEEHVFPGGAVEGDGA